MGTDREIAFVTQGSEEFADTLQCLAVTVDRHHPNATLYFYDGGLEPETRRALAAFSTTELVNWTDEATYDPTGREAWRLRFDEAVRDNTYLKHLVQSVLGFDFPAYFRRKDFYVRQKQHVLLDVLDRAEAPLVWIDCDAVLLGRIDDAFEHGEWDIAVTSRPVLDSKHARGSVKVLAPDDFVLNSGVVFFDCGIENIKEFVEEWISVTDSLPLSLAREQTALAKLCKRSGPDLFKQYYRSTEIPLESKRVRVKNLPCNPYNYFNLRGGIDPAEQKVLHFKGRLYERDLYRSLLESVEAGDVTEWTRHGP